MGPAELAAAMREAVLVVALRLERRVEVALQVPGPLQIPGVAASALRL